MFENVDIIELVLVLGAIYFGGIIHEIGHAWAALRFGDETAREMGRITLNPIPHFDFLMSFIVPVVLLISTGVPFGGMKPVPVNPYNFDNYDDWKSYRRADITVSLAGPAFQIGFSIIFFAVFLLLSPIINLGSYAFYFFYYGFIANVGIAIFNLLPIPPLDGSHVFKYFLPTEHRLTYLKAGRSIGMFGVGAFVIFGGAAWVLGPIRMIVSDLFIWAYMHLSLAVLIG